MNDPLDLNAYFTRIEYEGPTTPGYATLAGILDAHMTHIPFENFDVLLGRPVRLDLAALQTKLVAARRGGYCFEHATLFAAVLEALGFEPVRHAARVVLFQPRTQAARDHMFLSVTVGGARYIVDPGFGPFASRLPVPLDGSGVPAEHPTHRIVPDEGYHVLHNVRDGVDAPAWVSMLERENPLDFEVSNHFIATHPASLFTNWIMASALTPQGRVNIINREVTRIDGNTVTKSLLSDRAQLRRTLADDFGFDLPEVGTLRVPAIPEWA